MSSSRSRFMPGPGSVGGGQRLGALHGQGPAVDGEGAGTRPGAEQLDAEVVVRVALAQLGPLAEGGVERRGALGPLAVLEQRGAPAAQLDVAVGRLDDD